MSAGSERGTEKGRGRRGGERAGKPSQSRVYVRKLGRSAPPATDKGWEDACAAGCSLRSTGLQPERLRPPPVSDCKDHSISLAASPHPPRLAVPGACVPDPERGLAPYQTRSTGSRCLCPVGPRRSRGSWLGFVVGAGTQLSGSGLAWGRRSGSGGCSSRLPGGSCLRWPALARPAR